MNVFVRVHLQKYRPNSKYQRKSRSYVHTTNANHLHPSLSAIFLGERHALLDLGDRQRGVEALGARPRAVENGVASVQAHAVVEGVLTLGLLLVTRVGDPAVRLEQDGGSEVLLLVPPVGWARCRAAGAQDAFVEAVELLAVLLGLAVLTALVVLVDARYVKK